MSLGTQLINELATRRELGMYFSFSSYRALRCVDNFGQLSEFLRERGFPDDPPSSDVSQIADWLRATAAEDADQSLWVWMALDPFGLSAVFLPILLSRLKRSHK